MTTFPDSVSSFQVICTKRFSAAPFVLLMVGIVVFGFSGCKRPTEDPGSEPDQTQGGTAVASPKLSLPIQRTLTDQQGRKVAVTIVKRTPTHIGIIRKSDQKPFDLEIAKLADADRVFVEKLPVSSAAKPSAFVESRQAEIRKLEEKIKQHHNALESGTLNRSQASMANGKIERLTREMLDLQNQIVQHGK